MMSTVVQLNTVNFTGYCCRYKDLAFCQSSFITLVIVLLIATG